MAALNRTQTRWMMALCVALWWCIALESIDCAQTLKSTADHVVLATAPKTPSVKSPPANSTAPSPSPSPSSSPSPSPTPSPESAPSKAPAKRRPKRPTKSSSPSPSPSPSPSAASPTVTPDAPNGGMQRKIFASGIWVAILLPLAFVMGL